MADHCGRRNILLLNAVLYTVSALLLCLSTNIMYFCFFFFVWAIPRGLNPPVLALYLTENLPSKNRGKNFLLFIFFVPIGLTIASGVAYLVLDDFTSGDWRLYLLILGVYHILCTSLAYHFLPPSPRYLIFSGRLNQAETILTNLANDNNREEKLPPNLPTLLKTWQL